MRCGQRVGWGELVRVIAVASALTAVPACSESERAPSEARHGGERDSGRDGGRPQPDAGPVCAGSAQGGEIRELDLLFVIDTSISMAQEQALLARALPAFLRQLAPAQSGRRFHLGVVSTNLGFQPPLFMDDDGRCDPPGDYALLQRLGHRDEAGGPPAACRELLGRFITHEVGRDDVADAAFALSCLVQLGTAGCGYEQPLESALRALWPDHSEHALAGGPAAGHGDGVNAGFLEPESDAMLAVIALGDEDDCSYADGTFLLPSSQLNGDDPEQARWMTQGLRTRCALNPDQPYPLQRYVDGWRTLRAGRAERVFFAAIGGAPPEAVDPEMLSGVLDDAGQRERFYAELLARSDMQIQVEDNGTDELVDDGLVPSCRTASSTAYPPRRFTALARSFGAYGMVQSCCQDDYAASMQAIAARIDQLMREPRCR